jgi:hypothetical protein
MCGKQSVELNAELYAIMSVPAAGTGGADTQPKVQGATYVPGFWSVKGFRETASMAIADVYYQPVVKGE